MDADGIGGSVNMKTKTAGEFPTISLHGLGGYNPIIGGRANTETGGTFGHRLGRTRKLGILFGGSFDYNGRGIDNCAALALDPYAVHIQQADLR